jgi:hypothetical protein
VFLLNALMRNPFTAIALGLFIGTGVVVSVNSVNGTLARLEAATSEQCRNQDWPADAHQIHIDWCVNEGYLLPSE